MDFYALLDEVLELLRRRGRVTYRALKLQFQLDDDVLDDLKEELIKAQRVAVDENGDVLVWTGDVGSTPAHPHLTQPVQAPATEADRRSPTTPHQPNRVPQTPNAASSRCCSATSWTRPCSRASSTPKSWREVVRAYQETCAKVIARYEGHIAQYLGRWPAGLLRLSPGA